ncbi:MAG: nuclear transport factor 2 family protein [Myxococcales bacterium]
MGSLLVPIDQGFAEHFAHEWVAAWNAHDLDRIFSHYADDFEFSSPLIAQRGFSTTGTLRGKQAMRPYWSAGLASAPQLRFEIREVFAGADCVSIQYHSVGRGLVSEMFFFDEQRRVVRAAASYGRKIESPPQLQQACHAYRVDFDSLPWESPMPGVRHKVVSCEASALRLVEYSQEMPPHACERGHAGQILSGRLQVEISGQRLQFGPGDGLLIPPGPAHAHVAAALTPTVLALFVEKA